MSALEIVVGVIVLMATVAADPEIPESAIECAEKFDVIVTEAYAILSHDDAPIEEKYLCFAKCFLEKNDMLAEDGSIIGSKAFEAFFHNTTTSDASFEADFKEILSECNSKYNKDNCELAGHIYRCVKSGIGADDDDDDDDSDSDSKEDE